MTSKQDLISFIASVLELNYDEINENSQYGQLKNWDSLMHIRIIAELEEKYNINIPIDEVPNIKKIKDFFKYFVFQ